MFHWLLRTIPRPVLITFSLWFSKIAPLVYYGKKYEDPISGKTYRKFLPYGYSGRAKRKNVLCPGSLSLERHRLLWLYLKNKTNFFTANHKMLHIAPEQCFYKLFKAMKNIDYTTADLNSPIADVKMDLHHAPFADNTFDVIFCNHVLEHVDDDRQCMRELYRIMTKGGWGIFQVPMDSSRATTYEDKSIVTPEAREEAFWQKDHVRLFGLDYKTRLEEAGFTVIADDYANTFSKELIERYRLPAGEIIYLCGKN
ncbi:MAG TPA: methyltransferase domain-containing protein [Bacteroidia bacterium]|jgi:SAM-dependent methyltransferase|nr:methyltransferase domain-containing protein [Bacteroidia bacterium]